MGHQPTINESRNGVEELCDGARVHRHLAVVVADGDGRLTMLSRDLQHLLGTTAFGATARELAAPSHLYDADGTALLRPEQLPVNRAVHGETVHDAVISVRRPEQPARYLRSSPTPLMGADGEQNGALMLVADVTAERDQASRQDALRGLLLDTVNHELRTPLTVVLANAEILVDAAEELSAPLRASALAVARASGQLRDTVQHVSALVDLESVRHAVRSESRVGDLLAAAVKRHRSLAKAHNVTIALHCPRALTWDLDAALVSSAVSALLDNALTHGPHDSKVIVECHIVDGMLRVRVTDTGPGIPVEERERLTKPFERGSGCTHDSRHGRGLGLALAQAVATSHHGALSLSNREPRGLSASLLLA